MVEFGKKTHTKYLKPIHALIDIINENRDILDVIEEKAIIEKYKKEEEEEAKRELEIFRHLDLYYMDERGRAAKYIYFKLKSGVIKVIKSTRVGATTSLAIEAYLRTRHKITYAPPSFLGLKV